MSLLVIAATPLETDSFKAILKSHLTPVPLSKVFWGGFYTIDLPHLPLATIYLGHTGIAKTNTAATLSAILQASRTMQPLTPITKVLQYGIGGAFAGSFLSLGDLAVASREVHMDTGVQLQNDWQDMEALGFPLEHNPHSGQPLFNQMPTDEPTTALIHKHTGATPCRFGTAESVTGCLTQAKVLFERFDVSVESMEGAAAAQVCVRYGVPFAELRGISNIVGERNKQAWDIPKALSRVTQAVVHILPILASDKPTSSTNT